MKKNKIVTVNIDRGNIATLTEDEQAAENRFIAYYDTRLCFKKGMPDVPEDKLLVALDRMTDTCKTTDVNAVMQIVSDAAVGLRHTDKDTNLEIAFSQIADLKPQNHLEAMLISQMIAVNGAIGLAMARALLEGQTAYGKESNMNYAVKLQKVFLQQIEALQRLRGKGQQTVRVEHVTVNAGGQAIVGHVEHKGGAGENQE